MDGFGEPDKENYELQRVLDLKRDELEGIAQRPETKSWLAPCASSEEGTDKLLEELEARIERDDFADVITKERRLQEASASAPSPAHVPATPTASDASTAGHGLSGSEVLSPDWWDAVPGHLGDTTIEEDTGDYVVVEHSDVIDALAAFLAAYIVALPESRSMEPKQLQKAVRQSLKDIRKGKVRKLWDWGKTLYRVAAMTSGAFAACSNPWIADAIFRSLFTAARFARNFW